MVHLEDTYEVCHVDAKKANADMAVKVDSEHGMPAMWVSKLNVKVKKGQKLEDLNAKQRQSFIHQWQAIKFMEPFLAVPNQVQGKYEINPRNLSATYRSSYAMPTSRKKRYEPITEAITIYSAPELQRRRKNEEQQTRQ